MDNRSLRVGIILILAGVFSGLNAMGLIPGEWAIYMLAMGFLAAYFIFKRTVGFLIPGCILAAVGAFAGVENRYPGFDGLYFLLFLGTAFIAVFAIHTFHRGRNWGERHWPLFPGLSLMLIGGLALAVENNVLDFDLRYLNLLTPAVLIIIGVLLLVRTTRKTT